MSSFAVDIKACTVSDVRHFQSGDGLRTSTQSLGVSSWQETAKGCLFTNVDCARFFKLRVVFNVPNESQRVGSDVRRSYKQEL